ncbi:MAG: sigma-54-dependent Fis family transcriptional regulator [Gammaproteobacteria bacterium]|mgnify:CR=1 FL=1|nr:sigma-54-dependent Fis family transcriptional regulator [Gammaproteobacteria bacterium]
MLDKDYPFVFVDPVSVRLFDLAKKVAKAEISILITGASGSGKEVLAHVLHESSPRADGPFIALNCAAIPESLVESTLFGHSKGSFTGANASSEGYFEKANGGTLFLDEIGEMPMQLQAKLLRVLQENAVFRVGSTTPTPLDVRVLSATNININEAISKKLFREDLYFRLSGFRLEISDLCDRPLDILPLARLFLQKHSQQPFEFSAGAIQKLQTHLWPGNARELENVVSRAMILSPGLVITSDALAFDNLSTDVNDQRSEREVLDGPSHFEPGVESLDELLSAKITTLRGAKLTSELKEILEALARNHSRDAAAEDLGISTRTLRLKLNKFREAGLPVPKAYARA